MRILPLLLSALLPASAFADVTVQYAASSGGYRGMGASESKGTRYVSGSKAREDANVRFTGAVLGRLGGKKGKDTASILRVDLDKRWELDPKKKTYRESPITLPPPEPGEDEESPKEPKPAKEEKPTHRIKSARAEVKNTGEKKTINGFKTVKHAALLSVVIEEISTKKTAEYKMTSDIWAAPWTKKLRSAMDEEAKFQRAYLKKLGVELSPQDRSRYGLESARLLLAAAGPEIEKALAKLTRELASIDGYPIVTETAWRTPPPPAPAKGQKEADEDSALSDAAGAGSIGGAAMGLLGGIAKKAAKKKAAEAVAPKPGKPAFTVRTEIKKVETVSIPAERFELPKDYKKKG